MERFGLFCKKAFSYPALLHKTHPVTAVSIIVTTVLFAIHSLITLATDFADSGIFMELFFCLCMACLYFSVFSLCIESIRPHRSTKAGIAVFSLFALVAAFFALVLSDVGDKSHRAFFNFLSDIRFKAGNTTLVLYIAGLIAIAILMAMYFSYSRDNSQKFNTHILSVFSKIFFSSIIYGIIQLGVILLTLIVTVLLYDDAFEYVVTLLILINGLFYAPAVAYTLTHENEKANLFIEVIVRYISLVITLIGFGIIYIYMIKLIVTASVPSNSVFEILVALFIISMFISYMSTSYENKGLLQKFAYNCPLVFAPFIIMQGYTALVRVGQYGLTPKRYFGLAFILFEIVYIVYYYYIRKTEKEIAGQNILLIICAFTTICIFCPGISGKGLSNFVARQRMSSYLKKSSAGIAIPDREYVRINAAYGFLKDEEFGGDRLVRYFPDLTEDTVADMKSLTREADKRINNRISNNEDTALHSRYGWFETSLNELGDNDSLDISGYNHISQITITDNTGAEDKPVDTTKLTVGGETIDLSAFASELAKLTIQKDDGIITQSEFDSSCRKMCIIDVNENVRICITNANISIDEHEKITDINLDGFMFVK